MGTSHRDIGVNNFSIFHAGVETVDVLIDYDPSRATLGQTSVRHFMALDLIKGASSCETRY
ncbi:hypothetical protein BS47DRAFT_1342968 [Hydnum rufescens UP504]|uniref:Uncharacterized protein n=1 Tax=Hydnum rufescens UP504 TaxID=1448309 RepID=A0A9P6B0A1_9AGAM|nr:hypothetical protein BS47DRAFT_1342968 [Hydnum rufescens UP504]